VRSRSMLTIAITGTMVESCCQLRLWIDGDLEGTGCLPDSGVGGSGDRLCQRGGRDRHGDEEEKGREVADYILEVKDGEIYLDSELICKGDKARAIRLMSRYQSREALRLVFLAPLGDRTEYVKHYITLKGGKKLFAGYLWIVRAPNHKTLEVVAKSEKEAKSIARNLWQRNKRLPEGTELTKVPVER